MGAGQLVWVRRHGEQVVVAHVGGRRPGRGRPARGNHSGSPRCDDAHFPPAPAGPAARTPKGRTAAETEFLALGPGAALWLTEAAAAGTSRVPAKMAEAVALARLGDAGPGCSYGCQAAGARSSFGVAAETRVR